MGRGQREPQHSKGKKRPRDWHARLSEERAWAAILLPEVDSGADPTTGEPVPVHKHRRTGNMRRGDAVA